MMNASQKKSSLSLSPAQGRAARAMLQWGQIELEARSGVPRSSIVSFEREERRPRRATIEGLCRAFEEAGLRFVGDAGVIFGADVPDGDVMPSRRTKPTSAPPSAVELPIDLEERVHNAFGTQRGYISAAARALGVSQPLISLTLAGKRAPSDDILARLAQYEAGKTVTGALPPVSLSQLRPDSAAMALVPLAPDAQATPEDIARLREVFFDLMTAARSKGWSGRMLDAATNELFRKWRRRPLKP